MLNMGERFKRQLIKELIIPLIDSAIDYAYEAHKLNLPRESAKALFKSQWMKEAKKRKLWSKT